MANGKDGIFSWKWYRRKIPKDTPTDSKKDYSYIQTKLNDQLKDLKKVFNYRYSVESLEKRKKMELFPRFIFKLMLFEICKRMESLWGIFD